MLKKKFKGRIHHSSKDCSYDIGNFYISANKKLYRKKPENKKKIWSLVFFLVNIFVIAIVLAIQLNSEEGITSLNKVFNSGMKAEFILIAVLCFLGANLISSFKTHMMSKYYTKLTPFGVGGQPFQVYYFSKYGVKASNSLTMVSCSYVSNKLMYGLLALVMVCTFRFNKLLMSQGNIVNIVIVLEIISFAVLAIFLFLQVLFFLRNSTQILATER